MRSRHGNNSLLSRLFWGFSWFCLVSILLLRTNLALAQTATPPPVFVTAPPVATGTPDGLQVQLIRLDFRDDEQFFAEANGLWVAGVGWQAVGGSVTIAGNGNEYGPIDRVVFGYTSASDGLFYLEAYYQASTPYPVQSREIVDCVSPCLSPAFVMDGIISDQFSMIMECPGGCAIAWMDIYASTGGQNPDYEVDEDGCPILTEEEEELLDPAYYAACTRCFVDPTPVRDSMIPSAVLSTLTLNPTLQTTFSIPIIVSGTAVTATPGGIYVAPAPWSTSTPAPTGTSNATLTPTPPASGTITTYDFVPLNGAVTVDGDAGVYAVNYLRVDNGFTIDLGDWRYIHLVEVVWFKTSPNDGNNQTARLSADSYSIVSTPDYTMNVGGGDSERSQLMAWQNGSIPRIGQVIRVEFFGGTAPSYTRIKEVKVTWSAAHPPHTATPSNTPTPGATPAPWVGTPDLSQAACEVAVWADLDPVAAFDPELNVISNQCYTIVPEISIDLPGEGGLDVDGVQWCITWFEFPIITLLGITVSLDWLLVVVVAWLASLLLKF